MATFETKVNEAITANYANVFSDCGWLFRLPPQLIEMLSEPTRVRFYDWCEQFLLPIAYREDH